LQVVINLAVNARDAMSEGGVLTLACSSAFLDGGYVAMNAAAKIGNYVVIEVSDTGTGIPPEIRDRIFDPFFSTKEVGKGTGLGLSTSLGIVKSHGGFFNVYSEPGEGTAFKVYLPAESAGAEGASEEPGPSPRGNGELILLVDDEPSIRQVAKRTMESHGYRVIEASNGAEALATYVQHAKEVRLVIADMSMPVMDGAATVRALQHLEPKVRLIAASGLGGTGAFAKVGALGVKHFLQKPYTAASLLETLRDALA
jgi:CheY-like chemotaxis protein